MDFIRLHFDIPSPCEKGLLLLPLKGHIKDVRTLALEKLTGKVPLSLDYQAKKELDQSDNKVTAKVAITHENTNG